jgi:hypothetical protein
MLPHDLAVSWSAIHKHFLSWARDGTWELVLAEVRRQVAMPTTATPEPRPG